MAIIRSDILPGTRIRVRSRPDGGSLFDPLKIKEGKVTSCLRDKVTIAYDDGSHYWGSLHKLIYEVVAK